MGTLSDSWLIYVVIIGGLLCCLSVLFHCCIYCKKKKKSQKDQLNVVVEIVSDQPGSATSEQEEIGDLHDLHHKEQNNVMQLPPMPIHMNSSGLASELDLPGEKKEDIQNDAYDRTPTTNSMYDDGEKGPNKLITPTKGATDKENEDKIAVEDKVAVGDKVAIKKNGSVG